VGSQFNAVVADPEPASPPLALKSPHADKQLTDVRELAKQNPAAVAHIVRDWVNNEAT
jgi:flagellar M-ring protein FliF